MDVVIAVHVLFQQTDDNVLVSVQLKVQLGLEVVPDRLLQLRKIAAKYLVLYLQIYEYGSGQPVYRLNTQIVDVVIFRSKLPQELHLFLNAPEPWHHVVVLIYEHANLGAIQLQVFVDVGVRRHVVAVALPIYVVHCDIAQVYGLVQHSCLLTEFHVQRGSLYCVADLLEHVLRLQLGSVNTDPLQQDL